PYVTTRSAAEAQPGGAAPVGLGLGLFIAKTLIERSGAQITLSNAVGSDEHGAIVRVSWARHIFERGAVPRHSPDNTGSDTLPSRDIVPI
ncbi:hypothetical protein I3A86_25450, partial [Salmonella enterica]|nr:hypothetical protein [Salmonella enterica]